METSKIKFKALRNGIIAVFIILAINLTILYFLGFPLMAREIIRKYFLLLILLIGGFGFQVSLFTYLKHLNAISCSTTFVSGGVSTISMILCCSHYLLNFLPFLGVLISIPALMALSKYTFYLLLIGIASNILGITIMSYQLNKKIIEEEVKWK